jgi:GT2 family glycosyltransferase
MPNEPMTTSGVDVSVVIGFKDWGLDRLQLAVSTLLDSFGTLTGEVIVSDYGSTTCPEAREMIEKLGAIYVYTATDGVWSRSRALNAGFARSTGRVLVSTDADMLFSQSSMEVIGRRILDDPTEALVLQCRDLPEGFDAQHVDRHGLDWDRYERVCTLRPRWGMGGMMAVAREAFLAVRGFDERMQVYGGEDIDFAQRVRRSGRRVTWIEDRRVRMYHMWHPSSRFSAGQSVAGRAAIAFNRDILVNDESFVRNTTEWRHRPPDAAPAAAVVIVTRNRAQYLAESVHSALAQTVRDLEVIVVDDGSTDSTAEVMASVHDPRVRYFRREPQGIPASRNFAATQTRSAYTVIQDDDDLMLPDRVENHLQSLTAGDSGTYGGWLDWDDASGSIASVRLGKTCSLESLLFASEVFLHPTLMLETRVIREVGYDERFTSGSDYNLAIRLTRMGLRLRHTGRIHLLRRLHGSQVTHRDSGNQQSAARWTVAAALGAIPAERHAGLRRAAAQQPPLLPPIGADEAAVLAEPYLPDRLSSRSVHVTLPLSSATPSCLSGVDLVEIDRVDSPHGAVRCGVLSRASWRDMVELRAAGVLVTVVSSSRSSEHQPAPRFDLVDHCRTLANDGLLTAGLPGSRLVSGPPSEAAATDGTLIAHWRSGAEEVHLVAPEPQGVSLEEATPVGEEALLLPGGRRSYDLRPEALDVQRRLAVSASEVASAQSHTRDSVRRRQERRRRTAAASAKREQLLQRRLQKTRKALRQTTRERNHAVRGYRRVMQQHPLLVLASKALHRVSRMRRGVKLAAVLVAALCLLGFDSALLALADNAKESALLVAMTVSAGLVAAAGLGLSIGSRRVARAAATSAKQLDATLATRLTRLEESLQAHAESLAVDRATEGPGTGLIDESGAAVAAAGSRGRRTSHVPTGLEADLPPQRPAHAGHVTAGDQSELSGRSAPVNGAV